jgi:hypothetical protein
MSTEPKFLSSIQEEAKDAFNFELKDSDSSALRFIALHEKFCRHLTTAALKIRAAEKSVAKIRKEKHDWYIREYDVRLDRKELEAYVNSDEELVAAEDNLAYWKASAKYIEGILDGINRASFNLGNAIKWAMFKAGSN